MFGRKILFLAAWYFAGNIVSSIYSGSKKGKKHHNVSHALKTFVDTHEKIINTASKSYLNKDQQEKFQSFKSKFFKSFESLSKEGKTLLQDISQNESVKDFKNTAQKKMQNVWESWRKAVAKVSERVKKDSNKY